MFNRLGNLVAAVFAIALCAILVSRNGLAAAEPQIAEKLSAGWTPTAQRDEIRPRFSFDPQGGKNHDGALVIETDDSDGQNGWYQKSFPVVGGKFYQFDTSRFSKNVDVPRRDAPVRIVWHDAEGKAVRADPPAGLKPGVGANPLAEPEHPLDGPTDESGWTKVAGLYRAPAKATQAIVELHLQWVPRGRVEWSDISFAIASPPPSRKVRLATIHYIPSGKSPQKNCEEYEPLLAEAAKQKADLVVLGETTPYVRVRMKPHEVAEKIPGTTTDYFAELAKKHHFHLVVCLYEREGKNVYNTAVLLGPEGQIIGKYRKVCLPHSEIEAGVAPGSGYPVFETSLGKVGMMICYDGFFPEVARELTNRGAEVIAWPVWGCNPLLGRARACENHVYVVSSTYTDVKTNWMISAVFDHAGDPIAKAENWGDVALAEVDLSERYFWRNNLGDFHAMSQRHRPKPIVEKTSSLSVPSNPSPVINTEKKAMKTVAVLLFDGVELLDFTGPSEVFIVADRGRSFRVVTVADSTKPLKTMGGITVTPDFTFENAPKADVVVVPGGNMSRVGKAGRDWLKRASGEAEITMSVCYGALLLAETGLLDGLEATTHHWAIDDLKNAAPKCKVVSGKRYVDSGRVITTAGVTAGIDGALRIVQRLCGDEAAQWTADEWMEYKGERASVK